MPLPRFMIPFALAALLMALASPFSRAAVASRSDLHPQDGPHVDVRIFIAETEVRVRLEMNLVFLDEMIDFQIMQSSHHRQSSYKFWN